MFFNSGVINLQISVTKYNFISSYTVTFAMLFDDCSFETQLNGGNDELWTNDGGGSGGYLHHIAFYAAEQLLGIKPDKLDYKVIR